MITRVLLRRQRAPFTSEDHPSAAALLERLPSLLAMLADADGQPLLTHLSTIS